MKRVIILETGKILQWMQYKGPCLTERQLSLRTVLLPNERKTQLSADHLWKQVFEQACCAMTTHVTLPCMAALAFTLWRKLPLCLYCIDSQGGRSIMPLLYTTQSCAFSFSLICMARSRSRPHRKLRSISVSQDHLCREPVILDNVQKNG